MSHYRVPDEAAFAKIQAGIKAKSRKVTFGTGALQDDLQRAKARNAKRLKSSPGARGARGVAPGAPKVRERGKSTPSKPKLREAQVLRACMDILKAHPKVAIVWRQNTGAMKVDGRYLKFSFPGASDLMGVIPVLVTQEMVGETLGVFMAVECKATDGRMTDDQTAFLGNVAMAGGYATCVDDPVQLVQYLAALDECLALRYD